MNHGAPEGTRPPDRRQDPGQGHQDRHQATSAAPRTTNLGRKGGRAEGGNSAATHPKGRKKDPNSKPIGTPRPGVNGAPQRIRRSQLPKGLSVPSGPPGGGPPPSLQERPERAKEARRPR